MENLNFEVLQLSSSIGEGILQPIQLHVAAPDNLINCHQSKINSPQLPSPPPLHSHHGQIFSQVKAFLAESLLQVIPGSKGAFFQQLQSEYQVQLEHSEDHNTYVINGDLQQILQAEKGLERLLQQLHDPSAENLPSSFDLTFPPAKNDKSVMCDILKAEPMSRFAMEHPRRARQYHRLISSFILPKYQASRIVEKYKTKRKAKNAKKSSIYSQVKAELENKESMVITNDNSHLSATTDDTQSSNGHTALDLLCDIELGKKKPKKNYEELTPFKFFCTKCSFKTKRESHYIKHLAIHDKIGTLLRCSKCSFTAIRLGHLRRHELSHSATVYQCDQCSYRTSEVKLLSRHLKLKHERRDEPRKPAEVHQCPDCPYKTLKGYHFQRHLKVHNGGLKSPDVMTHVYQCDQCEYKTNRKEHYVRHVNNVHSNKRPFLCDLCGKAFKRADALRQHKNIHSGNDNRDYPFKCSACGKGCRSQAHLNEHNAVHSNVRAYLCEICGASFKTRSVQRKHVWSIHKNPRSHLCDQCEKRFNTSYALRRHMRLHATNESQLQTISQVSVPSLAPPLQQIQYQQVSTPQPSTHIQVQSSETLQQLTETYEHPDTLRHIPQTYIQTSEATTALLYLTSSFSQY